MLVCYAIDYYFPGHADIVSYLKKSLFIAKNIYVDSANIYTREITFNMYMYLVVSDSRIVVVDGWYFVG